VIDRPDLKLRFEAGPALRQADFVDRGEQNFVAARAAGYLSWRFSRGSEFTQLVRAYLQSHESSVVATSAVTSRLTETLSARASFEFRYESDPSIGRLETDTTTRATLVYSF
jgi:putative salt-induced outer membrane protein